MTYADQWKALAARIHGFAEAVELHLRFLSVNQSDSFGRGQHLRKQCTELALNVVGFRDRFEAELPPAAKIVINTFIANVEPLLRRSEMLEANFGNEMLSAPLVMLLALQSEMSYALADIQQLLYARSERAFLHLQRSIVADEDVRSKWQRAFEVGETACERLASIHLLLHGIWAFKINAKGERTDLVFTDHPIDDEVVYADGLVLTEWKLARKQDDPDRRFGEARKQAELYAAGSLAGNELTSYRYAIVVSERRVNVPQNQTRDGGIVYRHVNIAVDPAPPSK